MDIRLIPRSSSTRLLVLQPKCLCGRTELVLRGLQFPQTRQSTVHLHLRFQRAEIRIRTAREKHSCSLGEAPLARNAALICETESLPRYPINHCTCATGIPSFMSLVCWP